MVGRLGFLARSSALVAVMAAALALAGCSAQLPGGLAGKLPREWREAVNGPDATATPRLRELPTPTPAPEVGTPEPAPVPTRLPTLTLEATHTATATRTATPTPALETLTLQQGATWYNKGSFSPYEEMEDTYISDWSRNANFADAPILSVRQGNIMAALLYIHLGDLPQTLPVNRAELSLYISARSNDTPMTLTLRLAGKPWLLGEANWLRASNSLPWQKAGAQGEADRTEPPVAEIVVNERTGWVSVDLTGEVRAWLKDPQANQGLLITGEAANAVQYDITSSDSRDQQHRPRLTLTLPTGALLLAPPKTPTRTSTAAPTINPLSPESADVLRLLPFGSTLLARAVGDLDGKANLDIIAAYSSPAAAGLNVAVFTHIEGSSAGGYGLYWSSPELAGAAPASLDIVDITGDGAPEILLSAGAVGGGRMLYVFVRQPLGYRLAAPVGGYFEGKDFFGEAGFELADVNGDGRVDILARHAGIVDMYVWDGVNFTFTR